MERYAPYAICYAGHPERVARPVVDALLVVVPDHDAEVTEASLCQRRLQMVAHENRLLLGGVLAALPCLSAQRLVLYGQAEEVDALLAEVRLHNLLLILPTEPGVVVGRGLGERGAESEYLLIPPVRVEVHNPSLCQPVRQKWDVGPLGQHLLAVSFTPVDCRDRHGGPSFPASACWSDSRGGNPVLRCVSLMVDAGVQASCVTLGR